FPTCPCWGFTSVAVLGGDEDPRSPAITAEGLSVVDFGGSGGFIYVLGPEYWGADFFDIWGGIGGLPADQQVWIGFARYGVQENGRLDQADMLLSGRISAPDQLVLAGGSPGGDGARGADLFNWSAPYPADPNANPLVLGQVTTSAEGRAGIDAVLSANAVGGAPVYYQASEGFVASKSPFAPNDNGSLSAGQYNYMVVWGANPLTNANAPVLARVQVGADVAGTSMTVRNNAFAPFPSGQTDVTAVKSLPGGANAFAAPGIITLSGTGLPTLVDGTYAIWVYSITDNAYQLLATFNTTGGDEEIEIVLGDDEDVDFGEFNTLVISKEGSAPGAAPSSAQILWREYLSTDLALSGGDLTFGNFTPERQRTFIPAGAGDASFVRDSLIVKLNRLTSPPAGFQYAAYVAMLSPTGAIQGQQRVGVVTIDELGNARVGIAEEQIGSFATYNTFILVLEPIGSPSLTPALIQVSENWLDKFGDFFKTPEN
ncbi:MAG TPA: hypothetical protein VMK65_12480, partial [Longimicrobiales bacterium]|nr:hypothetical protein [Longimicrobiales bacterium]